MDIRDINLNEYGKIPKLTLETIQRYVENRIPAGGFVTAVLMNDLKEAVANGDKNNLDALVQIVKFIYNEAPMKCWGSKEAVNEWLMGGD